jgi:hypothetical protein
MMACRECVRKRSQCRYILRHGREITYRFGKCDDTRRLSRVQKAEVLRIETRFLVGFKLKTLGGGFLSCQHILQLQFHHTAQLDANSESFWY